MKYAFVERHRSVWPVRTMCRTFKVSPARFYDWSARAANKHAQEDARLAELIRASFLASDKTYGSPRVWRDLYDWGERCAKKRVARLMRAASPWARPKRRWPPIDEGLGPAHTIAPNVLDRQFSAAEPKQK